MELGLKGKVMLITGGTRGIGADIALGFVEEGARVAICARTKADLDAKSAEISKATGATVAGIPVDLSKPDEADRLVSEVVKRFSRLDILVNSAGVAPAGTIEQLSEEDWQRGIQLKLMGLVRCTRAAIPVMRAQGRGVIVNVSSIGVQTNPPRFSAYVASKAALDAWSNVVASEVVGDGIQINRPASGVGARRVAEDAIVRDRSQPALAKLVHYGLHVAGEAGLAACLH